MDRETAVDYLTTIGNILRSRKQFGFQSIAGVAVGLADPYATVRLLPGVTEAPPMSVPTPEDVTYIEYLIAMESLEDAFRICPSHPDWEVRMDDGAC